MLRSFCPRLECLTTSVIYLRSSLTGIVRNLSNRWVEEIKYPPILAAKFTRSDESISPVVAADYEHRFLLVMLFLWRGSRRKGRSPTTWTMFRSRQYNWKIGHRKVPLTGSPATVINSPRVLVPVHDRIKNSLEPITVMDGSPTTEAGSSAWERERIGNKEASPRSTQLYFVWSAMHSDHFLQTFRIFLRPANSGCFWIKNRINSRNSEDST